MIPRSAPAIANHLWQSTLFALAAAVVARVLKINQARVRYGVWLTASLKFLLPFSLFISLGSQLAPPHLSADAAHDWSTTVEEISQPFLTHPSPATQLAAADRARPLADLPTVLLAIWFCGFVAVLTRWARHWRTISATAADAVELREGREVLLLRQIECAAKMRRPLSIKLSDQALEPGIFGIRHPVLLWPEGISQHLEDAHLEAILTHEVCHVRRRDNLAAAIHMVIEAIFWFHPLVWWLGARLIEEREHACDEEVLQLGNQPHVYAESILKTCEFCMRSPLACVAGVTGADLTNRVHRIMTTQGASPLSRGKRLFIMAATIVTVALPISFGLFHPARSRAQASAEKHAAKLPAYEVVSIKPSQSNGPTMSRFMFTPSGFIGSNVPLKGLIQDAYGLKEHQVFGAPSWLGSEFYDVEAKVEIPDVAVLHQLTAEQRERMLQPVLADRLQLKVHFETRDATVYELVVDKKGPKLQEAKPGDTYPNGLKGPEGGGGAGLMRMRPGQLTAQAIPISDLTQILSERLGNTILDKTGLPGKYDIKLQWQEEGRPAPLPGPEGAQPGVSVAQDSSDPPIFTALQEQLGLRLESRKAPIQVMVIDHVERPSAN
jgi:uncharacterized protein (TIGR03435 family)